MEMGGLWGGFYRISQLISRFAYANLLWFAFTLLGAVILGIMPATVALFTITRKWIQGKTDIPVFKTFWNVYKKEFIKSNLLGIILFFLGYMLYANLVLLQTDDWLLSIVRYAVFFITIIFMIVVLYIFPVIVHYNVKLFASIKMALFIGLSYPHYVLFMIVGFICLQYVFMLIPGMILFFSVSLISYMMMWLANKVFKKMEQRHVELKAKTEELQLS